MHADDELGAHVSNAGGVHNAPGRARLLESAVLQLFTKQAQRWSEPVVTFDAAAAFRAANGDHEIGVQASHDSYLINLASPDPVLRSRSIASFAAELERCAALGIQLLVTHPGNATDGDLDSGMDRNADGLIDAVEQARLPHAARLPRILLETTAGAGTSVGSSFEHIAAILQRAERQVGRDVRFGVCADTCHLWAAGYDLQDGYDDVFARFDDLIGLDRLGLFHLNDSATPFGSRRDRHANIGEGSLGETPFRRIVTDPRFLSVPKVIETPKLPDVVTADRLNLERLRGYRRAG